ncbi:MAG: polymer-forming cytoskeletal protein [Phycisphaerales bacterium]
MAESITQTTVIGPDTQIKGEMTFEGSAKILGKFDGKIISKGEVQIGQGAVCKATIEAGTVIVDGEIAGNITARERVKLNASAKVTGDMVAKSLIVAEGAAFQGQYQVGPEAIEKALGTAASTDAVSVETRVNRPLAGAGTGRANGWNGTYGKTSDGTSVE